ncbi:hypothetical protein EC988_009462, partial [Linderina pennispora]
LNEDGLQKLTSEIDRLSFSAKFVPVLGDVTDEEVQQLAVDKAIACGTLVALVNSAGMVQPTGSIVNVSLTAFESQLRLNVVAPLALIQKTLPHLRSVNGRIINITSNACMLPVINHATYGATKAALNYITSVLAVEEPDITTVALHPGVVDTPLFAAMQDEFKEVGPSAREFSDFLDAKKIGPEVPGKIIGNLALYAEHSLSGKYVLHGIDDLAKY